MKFKRLLRIALAVMAGCVLLGASACRVIAADGALPPGAPTLRSQGDAVQLVVDGKPFLMLGGELNNSSSSSLVYMAKIWPHMNELHANTVLTPVSWEMIEPKEGVFDFSLIDGLLQGAREHHLHLVFLWLASWKNGMTSYDPLWMKAQYQRFPYAARADGTPIQVLSTLSKNNWTADADAFATLMRHLRVADARDHTVLMMQVENEVGILGDSRDRSAAANAAYAGQVPPALMDYLTANDQALVPELRTRWVQAGHRSSGTWTQVFGEGPRTDEIFMAWNYARYADHVAAAGKAAYPIPLYCNCWLADPMDSPPGNYPSGCPEAPVMDIWKAGASHIDLLAPDLYAGNFAERCALYTRRGNTLFVPEMHGDADGARNIFLAIGLHNALGTSPFGIDHVAADGPFSKSYDVLGQIAPLLLAHQGQGETTGFVLDTDHPRATCHMDGYEVNISLDSVFGRTASLGSGVVVCTGPGEFYGAGSGFRVAFRPLTPGPARAGIGTVDEGTFQDRVWVPGRRLNGDETDQGSGWRFNSSQMSIEKCTLFRYE